MLIQKKQVNCMHALQKGKLSSQRCRPAVLLGVAEEPPDVGREADEHNLLDHVSHHGEKLDFF